MVLHSDKHNQSNRSQQSELNLVNECQSWFDISHS